MIKFINEDLFKITTEKVSNDHGEYYKSDVTTAMNIIRGKEKTPGKQLITKIISSDENYNANNTAVSVLKLNSGNKKISIKSSERNKYDSRIYMIALPFNGFAEPLEETHLYKIHKGMIARSNKRNIKLDDGTYKKVLYLMVTLNEAVFSEDHKYHTDEIVLKFVSYNLESLDDGTSTTIKTVITVTFTENHVEYVTDSTDVDPINQDEFKGKRLFKVFEKRSTDKKERTKIENADDSEKEKQSVPVNTKKTDLDEMIAQYQKDASRNEKSRNKKGKKKRR